MPVTRNMNNEYRIVPLHKRSDLRDACCLLLNSEWPRSVTARLKSLSDSCDKFPTCLVLIDSTERVLGHCKVSLIPKLNHSCFIQSVVVDKQRRYQGLGSKLLELTEAYVAKKGIKNIYLVTKGQEVFYVKNGYRTCDPFQAYGIKDVLCSTASIVRAKLFKDKPPQTCGPPPPPMPKFEMPEFFDLTTRTHMLTHLPHKPVKHKHSDRTLRTINVKKTSFTALNEGENKENALSFAKVNEYIF